MSSPTVLYLIKDILIKCINYMIGGLLANSMIDKNEKSFKSKGKYNFFFPHWYLFYNWQKCRNS